MNEIARILGVTNQRRAWALRSLSDDGRAMIQNMLAGDGQGRQGHYSLLSVGDGWYVELYWVATDAARLNHPEERPPAFVNGPYWEFELRTIDIPADLPLVLG
jgi:hypothetical protein